MYKKFLNGILARFGYRLQNIHQLDIDLRDRIDDPREANYIVNVHRPFLINAPTQLGRGLCWYSFAEEGLHPFVLAVRRALALSSSDQTAAIQAILTQYNNMVQPYNALDVQGITKQDAPFIESQPPLVGMWVFPWGPQVNVLDEYIDQITTEYVNENRQWKLPKENETDIFYGLGTVSKEKIYMESRRLSNLMASIQEKGYIRAYGDIGATVLSTDSGWRWLVFGGEHRAAVLTAMGNAVIPIRVLKIVSRQDVDIWPNVRAGIYTRAGALKVFDRLFDANIRSLDFTWKEVANYYEESARNSN